MADLVAAKASPEKRLFISLLTRDIPLVAAFLDLIDNSINAAVEPFSERLKTAADYMSLMEDQSITPSVEIEINFSKTKVEISDDAGGIPATVAADHVFKFGRGSEDAHSDKGDRLSVYGIGLKRAMFKLGDTINMVSDHIDGGFSLNLDVPDWAAKVEQEWTFMIEPRPKATLGNTGTKINITDLHEEVITRFTDGVFERQLKDAIARTYAYFILKFVTIKVNGEQIVADEMNIGTNKSSETFNFGAVTCAVTAGIGVAQAGAFRDRSSGWFIFCNGRAVISADKTQLTGWGVTLPLFQPKHRPFTGLVYFVAEDPELLPWTTTKSSINEDSTVWQLAKRQMSTVGRVVISFLDHRYSDEGTEVASKDLQDAAGTSKTNILTAAFTGTQVFKAPAPKKNDNTRIQYDAKLADVRAIAKYLGRPSMSGSDVGRHTFQHFLRNEVGDE